ncbi:MAG: response regulator transcription factor [Spirochaetia bacterium]|nr:response regulator transcription factor [Spirochaetia bacterium]
MNPKSTKTESNATVWRIMHIEDHKLFRMGLSRLFEQEKTMRIVASCSGEEAEALLEKHKPDVVLLDLSMPGHDGLKLMEYIKDTLPETRVIALTMHKDREYFRSALARGAQGYILKDDAFDLVVESVRTVMNGAKYYSRAIRDMMVEEYEFQQDAAKSIHLLTPREQEILKMIAKGMMNKDIAAKVFLSTRTIETHRSKIMRKLRISNVQGLVRFAVENALI